MCKRGEWRTFPSFVSERGVFGMKNKGIKYSIIGILVVLLVVVGIFVAKNVAPNVNAALEITNALKPILEAENKSMHVNMDVSVDAQKLQMDADVYMVKDEDTDFLVIEQENGLFYIAEDILFLENGNAFLISQEGNEASVSQSSNAANLTDMFPLIAAAYEEFEIVRTENEASIQYQITVTGEQVQKLLEAAMMSQADMVDEIETIELSLVTKDGALEEIRMSGAAKVNSSSVELSMIVTEFEVLSEGAYEIPEVIKDSLQTVDKSELFCLTEDLYRLVKALEPLADTDALQGSVTIHANCGILKVNTTADLAELQSISTGSGNSTGQESTEIQNADEIQALPELLAMMIMEGELSCTEKNGAYVYALVLNEETMSELAHTIMPEMVSYAVSYEKGSIELIVEEDNVSTISVEITGSMNAIFTKVPVSVGIEFDFQ